MRFYRSIGPIKAISFDLDDTLYENGSIIQRAELAQLAFLHHTIPESMDSTTADWMVIRKQLLSEQPELNYKIGQLRRLGICRLLEGLGIDHKKAAQVSAQAFEVFYQERIKVEIADDVKTLLQSLAASYPLVAITNGNADVKTMGLADIFKFAIAAGDDDNRQKPYPDMFFAAAQKLGIKPAEILHIGDSLGSDVQGALNADAMAVWFNPDNHPLSTRSALPHLEIGTLDCLQQL